MRTLTLTFWLCLSAIPAFAQSTAAVPLPSPCAAAACYHAAPAPQIGLGIPSALAVGGILLGASLLRRRRR